MTDVPYIGCALTIIDPGPVRPRSKYGGHSPRTRRDGTPRVMKVWVEHVRPLAGFALEAHKSHKPTVDDQRIEWRAGNRKDFVLLSREGTEWVRGHGPAARDSLLAIRKLVGSAP